mmetsp:Transcript_68527/g.135439  ORF Transcript_68527/g.135439 Transcript_68527/m.135439 type:complete len:282 (+) Transcript_68527:444-1289(+)
MSPSAHPTSIGIGPCSCPPCSSTAATCISASVSVSGAVAARMPSANSCCSGLMAGIGGGTGGVVPGCCWCRCGCCRGGSGEVLQSRRGPPLLLWPPPARIAPDVSAQPTRRGTMPPLASRLAGRCCPTVAPRASKAGGLLERAPGPAQPAARCRAERPPPPVRAVVDRKASVEPVRRNSSTVFTTCPVRAVATRAPWLLEVVLLITVAWVPPGLPPNTGDVTAKASAPGPAAAAFAAAAAANTLPARANWHVRPEDRARIARSTCGSLGQAAPSAHRAVAL